MKKSIFLLRVFLLFIFPISSIFLSVQIEAQTIIWQESLGGTEPDGANSVSLTSDSGYIVAGYSMSHDGDLNKNYGKSDFWVVKLNGSGKIQWQKPLGGSKGEEAKAIEQTRDGGYIIAGYSESQNDEVSGNHGSYDMWIVSLDKKGTIQWQKSFGGSGDDGANAVQQTRDGGYIVTGYSGSFDGNATLNHGDKDCWVVKLDGSGNLKWQKSFGGSGEDVAFSVQQTSEGGYIIAGTTDSRDGDVTVNHGGKDFWIIRLSDAGVLLWQEFLGGGGNDKANFICQTIDGGYVVAGSSTSDNGDVTGNHGTSDCWVVKLNESGKIEWQKSLGGSDFDVAYSIQQTTDGGYVVGGTSSSKDGDLTFNYGSFDWWVIKLDNSGNIQWQKSLGGSDDDEAYSIRQTKDGSVIVAGLSASVDGDVAGNHGKWDCWVARLK